ncbi:hypothetical protein IC235_09370 [Hymenobacter sp. BT664]|uniref:Uncharacterized protein n=1 Tax=Hymenobacter montanus TaxID=2771359 RepID=A0A927GJ42_9BACT|nr:hypothetical protein [Hymenobacter montanus]MBD2768098.1 hypothetical protein [Hymenobacter montanus]
MEKKVVYESRPKLIALLAINWGFVVLCLWSRYWSGLAFFGLCAIVTTYPLLDPRKKLLFYGTSAYRAQLTITEETAGWHVFLEQLEAHLSIPLSWFADVSVPAFETKLTLLYEQEHRSFAEAVTVYYLAEAQPAY